MIIISGTITMDPAALDAAVAAIAALESATNAEEGCITYGFWHSPHQPGTFRVYEEWASAEAIDAHTASDHMAAFMVAAAEFGISGMEIWRFDGAERSRFL